MLRKPILTILVVVAMSLLASGVGQAAQADRISHLPLKVLKKESRKVAKRQVYGTCWGCASRYMRRLQEELILRYFPSWNEGLALCIAHRESGLNPHAISRTNDHGVAQLNRPTWDSRWNPRVLYAHPGGLGIATDWRKIYDPVYSTWLYRYMVSLKGFGPWGNHC